MNNDGSCQINDAVFFSSLICIKLYKNIFLSKVILNKCFDNGDKMTDSFPSIMLKGNFATVTDLLSILFNTRHATQNVYSYNHIFMSEMTFTH